MKKVIALITLIALLVCSLTACGSKPADDNAGAASMTAIDAMTAIWDAHGEDQKFAVMGGDMNNIVDGAPGAFSIEDAASVDMTLGLPESEISKVTGAASLVHMMNANTFTAAAYDLAEGTDAAALAETIKTHLADREWMCGFPEKLVIMNVGGTLVTAFGAGDLIDNFVAAAQSAVSGSTVLVDTALEF